MSQEGCGASVEMNARSWDAVIFQVVHLVVKRTYLYTLVPLFNAIKRDWSGSRICILIRHLLRDIFLFTPKYFCMFLDISRTIYAELHTFHLLRMVDVYSRIAGHIFQLARLHQRQTSDVMRTLTSNGKCRSVSWPPLHPLSIGVYFFSTHPTLSGESVLSFQLT